MRRVRGKQGVERKMFESARALMRRRPRLNSVYVMTDGTACKIGRSSSVANRTKNLQVGSSRPIRMFYAITLDRAEAMVIERTVHAALTTAGRHLSGEWFAVDPSAAQGLVENAVAAAGFKSMTDFQCGHDRG